MSMKKILVLSLVSLFIFALSVAAVSADTKTVTLNISPGQWVTDQHIGVITVPMGGTAANFQASGTFYDKHGKAKNLIFAIQKRNDNGEYMTVYERTMGIFETYMPYRASECRKSMYDWKYGYKQIIEQPVSLSQLTLGPGHYIVTMYGYGGSTLQLTYTLQP